MEEEIKQAQETQTIQPIETMDLSQHMIEPRKDNASAKSKLITLLLAINLLLGVASISGIGYLIYKESQQPDFSNRDGMMFRQGNNSGNGPQFFQNGGQFSPNGGTNQQTD